MYKKVGKRLVDIGIGIPVLLLTAPLMIGISILLFFSNSGSPFFIQKRPGQWGNLFNVVKFKTMNDKRSALGTLLPDADRLTRVGKLIRSTSMDELPQLFNVIIGHMSLVGPRPLLERYLPLYNERQSRRHEVRPGITGWAQVNGRNAISWQERFELDIYYVDNVSLWLDLKILLRTIVKVIKREGISGQGSKTMKPFNGN